MQEETTLDVRFYQKHYNRKTLGDLKARLMKDVRGPPGVLGRRARGSQIWPSRRLPR